MQPHKSTRPTWQCITAQSHNRISPLPAQTAPKCLYTDPPWSNISVKNDIIQSHQERINNSVPAAEIPILPQLFRYFEAHTVLTPSFGPHPSFSSSRGPIGVVQVSSHRAKIQPTTEMAEAMSRPYCLCCIESSQWFAHSGEKDTSHWFLSLGVKWKSLGLLWSVQLSVALHCCTPRIWGKFFFSFFSPLMGEQWPQVVD